MNSKLIASAVVALAALTGANAFAQSVTFGEVTSFPVTASSNTTRSEVKAEYVQARQAGQVAASNEVTFAPEMVAPGIANRADVRAEAAAWVKTHNAVGEAS